MATIFAADIGGTNCELAIFQMVGFMEDIAVHLILRKDAALIGAANYIRQELKKSGFADDQ